MICFLTQYMIWYVVLSYIIELIRQSTALVRKFIIRVDIQTQVHIVIVGSTHTQYSKSITVIVELRPLNCS